MAGLETSTWRKLEEFHLFPLLAKELRLKIWAFALPGARTVHVNYSRTTNVFLEWSEPATTNLVLVNWEAREAALHHYKAYFGTRNHAAMIYVDLRIDVIQLNFDAFRCWKVEDQVFNNIRYLEITDRELYQVSVARLIIRLQLMPKLKQLIVLDPRSPFIEHPHPAFPNPVTPETMVLFFLARGEHLLGRKWELRYREMWNNLIEIDNAVRHGNLGLPNIAVGMVGVTSDAVRRYRMVG